MLSIHRSQWGWPGLQKKPGVYDLLVDIYLHDKDEVNRVQAIVGILWRDGKLNSVNDPMELFEKIDLIRTFKLDSEEERTKQGENILKNPDNQKLFSPEEVEKLLKKAGH